MTDHERALSLRAQHDTLRSFTAALAAGGIEYRLNQRPIQIRDFHGYSAWTQTYVMVAVEDGWESVGAAFKEDERHG